MSMRKLPRATSATRFTLDGALWNRLADEVERLGKWHVGGSADFSDGVGGFSLVVNGGGDDSSVAVKIVSSTATRGLWNGKILTGGPPSRPGATGELTDGVDCTVVNQPEFYTSPEVAYAIPADYPEVIGRQWGTDPDNDDRPVVYVTVPLQPCG